MALVLQRKKKKEKNSSTSFCQSAEFKLLAQGVSMPISNFMGELIDLLGAYGMYVHTGILSMDTKVP